ncbi:M23 family metallopeptidase [Psychroserpens sp.]|uniref:M23 family metallopeptidase n=2 Tax=Psychroserpens sp. TaxID=2020870 RepID=UPI001B1DC11E|nr:M23 family metallopeptidase [Psychroserpens sp.]MBO6606397.1 peptidoglycan DD-metalloendopeptidase family protein [Psychroserpens sp.]MBO6631284.1 peptidoglycan DD-metalloendopeptidase family protein [Psychroserpens sp.]MBO6653101.1 peptidoglycan DD-metalloendopeptidase family protein [Psychroserpens sp.]MBO6680871.1 peptidoglycan DD-metalloendopeptidase family protein [Psychroserpens sp.]MBO6750171.1 peptidoglycan DD-metalloendopeptidase family protein [Psychroserpens sp.]
MNFRLVIFFSFMTFGLHAQKSPKLELYDFSDFDDIVAIDSLASSEVALPDIKAKFWEHTVYNPYKSVDVTFPVKLTFDDTTYASPIGKEKVITSRYGWRWGRAHKGIDIDLITGDSLFAMFDGVIRFARYNSGHGRTVIVRHYNGLETVYAHLSRYGVKENDTVIKGQYLGKGGASGNARGSHLHLVVNYKGVSINPEYLFDFNNEDNRVRAEEIWVTKEWTRPYAHNSRRQSKIQPILTEAEALKTLVKERRVYVVKRGDTLSRISRRNNVSVASLCKTNSINRNSVIKIGQRLIIEN